MGKTLRFVRADALVGARLLQNHWGKFCTGNKSCCGPEVRCFTALLPESKVRDAERQWCVGKQGGYGKQEIRS